MKRLFVVVLILASLVYVSCSPVREFYRVPVYDGTLPPVDAPVTIDQQKKTVLLIAYNKGTEIFDLMAPFNLFHLTGQANVYIVAPEKSPIAVMQGLFTMPHYTFREIDSLQIHASVIVLPNLSAMDKKQQDTSIVNWIKRKYSDSTALLSVCAGSFTAAATGLYDGKLLTTHATDMPLNKKLYPAPKWVKNVSFTKSGNLYSTAGVSNATEGSLAVIRDVFGENVMNRVMKSINYPNATLKTSHQSVMVDAGNKRSILGKVLLKKDHDVAVLLQDGIDEFKLSAVLDAYHRTFPAKLNSYSLKSAGVISRFGLQLMPSADFKQMNKADEVHILMPGSLNDIEKQAVKKNVHVEYAPQSTRYVYDECLERILKIHGRKIHLVTKRLLDYN